MKFLDPKTLLNLKPTFSVAVNALTITLKGNDGNDLSASNPGHLAQRHATLSDGSHNLRKLEANVSLVISSGSTLGHASAVLRPIYIYLIDNAGAQELAAAGSFLGESGIVSTTAEGGAGTADSATLMYSTNARANVPFRLIAIAQSNQAVAGTWTALPAELRPPPFEPRETSKQPTITLITSGSGTYTTPAAVTRLRVRMVGGGGGGQGGVAAGQAGASAAGGGYTEKLIALPAASYSYAVGAAGTAGTSGSGVGGNGGTTTFGTAFLSATGGSGASTSTSINGGVGSGGDINIAGQGGMVNAVTTSQTSHQGGSSVLGGGAAGAYNAAGNAPVGGYGGGGSGGVNSTVGGGAGAAGVIIVEEYYD